MRYRDIPGYEGVYEVSEFGEVRSVERFVERNGHKLRINSRKIKLSEHPAGHLWFNASLNGKGKKMYAHRAVALAFIGEIPEGMEVRHLDGDATNNFVGNLAFGTREDNMQDAIRHGTYVHSKRTHCKRGHLLEGSYLKLRKKGKWYEKTCIPCSRANARNYSRDMSEFELKKLSDEIALEIKNG